jgi:hypothetical protein
MQEHLAEAREILKDAGILIQKALGTPFVSFSNNLFNDARHLKMNIGRVTKHWHRNCLAVGLAQGFIEPLEATALLFIQRTATTFV